jgi:hypothetical protein
MSGATARYHRLEPESASSRCRLALDDCHVMSACPDKPTSLAPLVVSAKCQFRKSARLLDHFVRQRKQPRRNFKFECLGGIEVFECC